jgi:membrane-bound metal-dependent hydrolase YbcI (DUF457 family)
MPLPIAHGLIGASVVVLSREGFSWRRDWRAVLLGATVAVIPDFDLFFSWVLGYGLKWHGGFTHSIIFSMVIGSLVVALMREGGTRDILVYTMATLSHGVLDVITKKEFGGSQLFWPFSPHRYRLGLFSYFEFYPDPATGAISSILARGLLISCYEALIFAPILVFVVWWKSRRKEGIGIGRVDFEKGD